MYYINVFIKLYRPILEFSSNKTISMKDLDLFRIHLVRLAGVNPMLMASD